MKVLKAGNAKWSHQFACGGCSAKLEADKSDLQYRVTDAVAVAQQYQLDIEGEFYVICPECETEKKIKNLPPIIKKEIIQR